MVKKVCSILALCIWMFCIFSFSAQPAEESSALSNAVKEQIVKIAQKFSLDLFEEKTETEEEGFLVPLIRKSAHFFVYLILGVLSILTLLSFDLKQRRWLIAFLFCVVYAISDEIHQIFVPGRAGRFMDVCIDSAGAALGILICFGMKRKREKKLRIA